MVVLIVTYDDMSYLAKQSCKETSTTASIVTHVNGDVLILGIWYQDGQLHEGLLNRIKIWLLVPGGAAWACACLWCTPPRNRRHAC